MELFLFLFANNEFIDIVQKNLTFLTVAPFEFKYPYTSGHQLVECHQLVDPGVSRLITISGSGTGQRQLRQTHAADPFQEGASTSP